MEHRQSSFISKLPVILATIQVRKAELADKKQQILEAKRVGAANIQDLEIEWGSLESEIDLLEHTANVMSMDLVQVQPAKPMDDMTQDMVLVDGKV